MAHKKGQGSVKNGRDSESKRLGVKRAGRSICSSRKYFNKTKRNKGTSRY